MVRRLFDSIGPEAVRIDEEIEAGDSQADTWRPDDEGEAARPTAPCTPMPAIFASIPRPPRVPAWAQWLCAPTEADGPSSQHDVEITQTRLEPWFPTPADEDAVISDDGLICVPRPFGAGWRCERSQAEALGCRITMVKCLRSGRTGVSFFLVAKDYEVPGDAVLGLEELGSCVYGDEDETTYTNVRRKRAMVIEHRGHAAYEVTLEATQRQGRRTRRVRRIERVVVVGTRVLVLRAEGSLRSFDRHARERARFFEATRFAHLR